MYIGNVELKNNIILAPMAGVTDMPFRIICKEYDAGLVYSEMISAKGLYYGSENTIDMLKYTEVEKPIAAQIFGHDAKIMSEMAKYVQNKGVAIIDINMGCPAPKIVKNGDGSALMKSPELVADIVARMVKAVDIPITVKIRKGWDSYSINAMEIAHIAEDNGAAALTIHGRTRQEFYSGEADWNIIKNIKSSLKIPVIGNGDVTDPLCAKAMIDATNCDGVMIGRAAMGNPWIFDATVKYLETGVLIDAPTKSDKVLMAIRHLDMLANEKDEHFAVREMRGHISSYLKGLRGAAVIRNIIMKLETKKEVTDVLLNFLEKELN